MTLKILDEEEPEVDNDKTQIIKLSASAVKTYEQCPKKYYYTYIEKAAKKQWDHFDLGNLCHKALEIFHEIYMHEGLKKKRSYAKLMSYAFSLAREKYPNLNDSILLEAKDLCSNYLDKVKNDGMPMVKGIETSFDIKLRDDVRLRGFLDRLDVLKDGRFHIVDYKTTKNDKYLDEFQLLVYGIWLKENYPDLESFKGSYVLLRHNSKYKEYEFNLEDILRAKKSLLEYADSIRNDNSWTPVPTILCRWCDFNNICEANKAW